MKRPYFILLLIFLFLGGCSENNIQAPDTLETLTIFTLNDVHGQIDNFAKVKHIIDAERQNTDVLIASAGDLFSGNPVVDSHEEKGYPLIDLMNKIGVDIAVLGNHEFDYGETHLKNRFEQAEFDFICANVDMQNSILPQPEPFKTIMLGNTSVTFLGLVETNGSDNEIIPSTHPWRVENLEFTRPEIAAAEYANLKSIEGSDLMIALTHIGHDGGSNALGDYQLAENYPFFDLIIGGHSHREINTEVNGIPVFQTGSYLHNLGKIELKIKNKKIESYAFTLIDLDSYPSFDPAMKELIDGYNDQPYLNDKIGFSAVYHQRAEVGCFYTDALRGKMGVDLTFQNTGGVRSDLDQGDIIKREIYEISPFNNGTVIYSMTVGEVRTFLKESNAGFYYSGLDISQAGNQVVIRSQAGDILEIEEVLTVGVNDYIPAVHKNLFPANGEIQALSAAETLIAYLVEVNDQVNYTDCPRYFRFQN